MFTWSNVHIMNAYVVNVCIREDDKKSPKMLPPPLPITYPKMYSIIFPNIISYANTSHLIIAFVDIVQT